ncbi:MAG: RagB/SusD family nutrient uptake outer membrane protein [Chitinophagaceae bacterium]|nr:MAG: RagB/SusD family nutrient uptake outer membrane protein [Chitinophagaceae bacterium]
MKKQHIFIGSLLIIIVISFLGSCKKFLAEKVYTEYSPSTFVSTPDGINSLLVAAYGAEAIREYYARDYIYMINEFCTDEMDETGGGLEFQAAVFTQFNWDPTNSIFEEVWSNNYVAIRNANVVLDNIKNIKSLPPDEVSEFTAEARFIRAVAYVHLYYTFGPTPLIITAQTIDLSPTRPTDSTFIQFVETELTEAAANLPVTAASGKATKGAALGVLCKFYLNTKQWQECVNTADEIIGLNQYSLFSDITTLFAVQNNHNDEYIYYYPCVHAPAGYGNITMAHCFPDNYPIQSNWVNFAANFHVLTSLIDSYASFDKRIKLIDTSYVNLAGKLIELNHDAQGNPLNLSAPFKYTPDPDASGVDMANYIPMVRYADILLSKAEALNNLQGPNSESFTLIDMVRNRSGLPNLDLSQYNTSQELNDEILQEREWEFVGEGLRRQDLIRMGKFISSAQARGFNAKQYQTLYPIPQDEIQSNPKLTQNQGY